jgi:phage FluMu gp28-like protein
LAKQKQGAYLFITGIGLILGMAMCRSAKQVLTHLTNGEYVDSDNSTTITFPNGSRFQFFGSDSKSYRGQGLVGQQVVFVCADECAWFEDSDNWLASIDAFAVKAGGNTEMILITTPSNKLHGLAHNLFESENGLLPYNQNSMATYRE